MIPEPPLLVITDRQSATAGLRTTLEAVFAAGGRWVMVREKDLATGDLTDLTADIVAMARPFDAMVIVNGDPVAARRAGARGVHLPRGASIADARAFLGGNAMVGASAHSLAEAENAAAAGADYITLSPVFASISKPGYGPLIGLDGLSAVTRVLAVPVVALGGIEPGNAERCLDAGAIAVAVMGSVMRANGPEAAVRDLLHDLSRAVR